MSERTDLARAMLELWNAGVRGVQDFAPYCAPDFELESPLSAVAGEPYRGVAGLRAWIGDVEEQFSEWQIANGQTREVGEAVLTIATIRARGRASGVALEFDAAAVLRFNEDGLLARLRIYAQVGEALAALGLER